MCGGTHRAEHQMHSLKLLNVSLHVCVTHINIWYLSDGMEIIL